MMSKQVICCGVMLGWLVVAGACRQAGQESAVAGVSRELAEERKADIKDLHYQLHFSIPERKTEAVEGRVKISFTRAEAGQVVLDFREKPEAVETVQVNGEKIWPVVVDEHVIVPALNVRRGKNEVVIGFVAGDQSLNRNEDYLYTLLVPDRARTLFPCFDQPDLKAAFTLELEVPEDWVAVANAPVAREKRSEGRKRVVFEKTEPLSTYLFAFVAGRWEKLEETRDGRTVRLYHRETDTAKLAQSGVIFNQVFSALRWMEEYTGIPYPFAKYDLVVVPGFQFGGMEHAGAVLYNDKRMFLSESPTVEEELGRMELIAHETAHMWFGDDVTMAWFDDVWTKEVFANYFAAKMTEPEFPQVNHALNALRSFYPAAYSEDRTEGTNAIRQPLDNLNSAGLIYGQIVYNKAPVVMGKLVERMGGDAFRHGIQEYLRRYAYGNATWDGLIGILDGYTEADLAAWSRVWVDEKGMPVISAVCRGEELVVRQTDLLGRSLVWLQRVSYALYRRAVGGSSGYDVERVTLDLTDSVNVLKVRPGVEYAVPNADGKGYGYFVFDRKTGAFCLDQLARFEDPVMRLAVVIGLNESRLNGCMTADEFTEGILKHLKVEQEPLIFTAALGYVKDACLRKQMGTNTATEKALLGLAQAGEKTEFRQAAWRALLDVWTLPEITQEVYRVRGDKKAWERYALGERDGMKMAYELAVRMPEKARQIIDEQAVGIVNPDRRREFGFVGRAVHPVKEVRDSLFRSLLVAENRRMEPWVEQVMYYLNHPLRGTEVVGYILPALENLQEIQRTGDIFFPKNWVSACLRGHNSAEAGRVVRQFLESRPDYPPLLRNKILQSADHLYRGAGE